MERFKIKILLAAILSIACLGSALMVNARAISVFMDGDDDGIEDEVEERNSRVLEVEDDLATDDQLKIKSHLEHSTLYSENNNSMEIKFKNETGNGLEVEISYNNDTTEDSDLEIEFGIEFNSLLNYSDDDSNGRYNSDNDTEGTITPLASFNITYSAISINGTSGYKIVASETTINFTVIGYILQSYADVNGSILSPTEIMIDIIIGDLVGTYDWALNMSLHTSSDDGVGSEYEYEAQTEDESHGHVSGEYGLQTRNSSSNMNGAFTWNETASVDGVAHQVNHTLEDLGGQDDSYVFLCYEHGGEIVHDPKLLVEGIENVIPGSSPGNEILIIVVVGISIAAVIIAIAVIMRHKKSRKT